MRFLSGEDDGDALRALCSDDIRHPVEFHSEHVTVQKQNGGERLILGGGGDPTLDGQVRQGTLSRPGWRVLADGADGEKECTDDSN